MLRSETGTIYTLAKSVNKPHPPRFCQTERRNWFAEVRRFLREIRQLGLQYQADEFSTMAPTKDRHGKVDGGRG